MFHPCTRSLGFALALVLPLAAQSSAPAPMLSGSSSHGLPGRLAGSERWIVHFATRAFDLSAFRAAVYAHRPANEVGVEVAALERAVVADQAAFVGAAEALGARVAEQWWIVNACVVEIAPAQLGALRSLPNIALVQPDVEYPAVILTATDANNHDADALQAQGHIGTGVAAAIMDTGQDQDVGGSGRPHRTYFVNGDPSNSSGGGIGGSRLVVNRQMGSMTPDDVHGHGTGVASIVAGADWVTSLSDDGHAPGASIAGYSIANATNGNSSGATMASAWQQIATDRIAYSIVAANLSYSGSPSPVDVAQQALDSAAFNADIMCCVAAANTGPNPGSTTSSQSGANGLAVAAVNPNAHAVAGFSSRGPMSGDSQRFYPDIAACGVSTVMARRDAEGSNYVGSGTSMASPQVTGAATQLRGRFTALTALETKATLLAATVDIGSNNPGLTRNDFGMGLLKNTRAHTLVAAGQVGTATVSAGAPTWTFSLPATAGQTFAIAIAWHRMDFASINWSDLDLEVLDPNGAVLVSSTTPRNLYEMVRFLSPVTGNLTVRTVANSVLGGPTQAFAFAWTDSPGATFPGSITAFGAGCTGTGQAPNACASINPNGGSLAVATRAYEYGYDLTAANPILVTDFEVFSQSTTTLAETVNAAIYGSVGGSPNPLPLATTTVTIGVAPGFYRGTFASPVRLPAGPLWISVDHTAQTTALSQLSSGTAGGAWYRSAFGSGSWTRSGLVTTPAVRVLCVGSGGNADPAHAVTGSPALNGTLGFELSQAAPNSLAVALIGISDTNWIGGALPFSLAALGATGCTLLVSTETAVQAATDAQGQAAFGITVPNAANLVGTRLYSQFVVIDPGANTLGLALSNGVRTVVGN